jgi:hypothetical protein
MQTEIARHGPMIRCVRVSDGRLRRRQALREYENQRSHPEGREFPGELLVLIRVILQNRSGIQHQRGNQEVAPPRTSPDRDFVLKSPPITMALTVGIAVPNHVMDVRQKLSDSDFTFLNVLGGLRSLRMIQAY